MVTTDEVKQIIRQELPNAIATDPAIRDFILQTSRTEMDDKFDRILGELQRDREEQSRKWDEQKREESQKWDEQARRWEEQKREESQKWDEQARKWEEQNRRWEEQKREESQKWDEQSQKWDEQNRRWEEQKREESQKWDEQSQKWEEQKRGESQKWDEQNRRWEEQKREESQKWDEQAQKWDEQKRTWEEQIQRIDQSLREIKLQNQRLDTIEESLREINQRIEAGFKENQRRYDSTIGALGARWGLHSEQSFRNALAGILSDSFGVQVINFNEMDLSGTVFGRPDQVEIDVIIKNGLTIVCEIKSSINKGDMYLFDRKVEFYAQHQNRRVNRKLVISPMVDVNALPVAQLLGIEVYSYAQDVTDL